LLGNGFWANFQADRLYKSNDTYVVPSRHLKREEVSVAVRHSKTPELNLNFIRGKENVTHSAQGETVFCGGNFLFRIV